MASEDRDVPGFLPLCSESSLLDSFTITRGLLPGHWRTAVRSDKLSQEGGRRKAKEQTRAGDEGSEPLAEALL